MSKGMVTCEVCGRDFALMAEEHYISRGEDKTGIMALAGGSESHLHDAIDCPHCGCQKLLQKRERLWYPEVEVVHEEVETSEEEEVGENE